MTVPIVVFLLKRFVGMALIVFAVSFLVFSLLALSPGSAVMTLLGTRPSTPEAIAALTLRYHLNESFLAQYGHWLAGAAHGDFGRSTQSGATATSVIASHVPVTIELALYALLLVVVIGIPAGMLAGVRRGGWFDRAISGLTIIGMSAPGFAVGILLIYLLGVRVQMFPIYGAGGSMFVDRIEHLTLPAVALASGLVALIVRQTRASVLDVMTKDYVTFARARGLSRTRIMTRYALRNTALPVVTAAGLLLIVAISGALLVETVFALPGVGSLMVQSVNAKDIPVVQALAFFIALLVVLVNLLVDTAALIIDPRTRTAAKG